MEVTATSMYYFTSPAARSPFGRIKCGSPENRTHAQISNSFLAARAGLIRQIIQNDNLVPKKNDCSIKRIIKKHTVNSPFLHVDLGLIMAAGADILPRDCDSLPFQPQ
jgi:hypothetical protein